MLARPLDRRWLAAAAALFVLDIALHLPIEDVFDDVARRYGFFWYDALAQRVFIALGVALVAALWWWARPARRSVVRRATIAVVVAMLLAKGFLLVAAIENIHYPQYALMVIALARAGLALEPSWLIAVGLGVVDEYYQFVMLPRGTPNYLDADDIVLNAIGGLLGVIAVLAWFEREPESPLIPSSTASRLVLLAVVVGVHLRAGLPFAFLQHDTGRPALPPAHVVRNGARARDAVGRRPAPRRESAGCDWAGLKACATDDTALRRPSASHRVAQAFRPARRRRIRSVRAGDRAHRGPPRRDATSAIRRTT